MLTSRLVLLLTLSAVWCSDLIYYIKEEKSPGTLVGDIAVDAHLKGYPSPVTHSDVQFNLEQQSSANGSEFFTLSSINKKLYTAKTIDAESSCTRNAECYFIVNLEILRTGSLVQTLTIKIIIEDENDNEPEFPEDSFDLQFSEKDSIGTQRPIPYATDKDVSIANSQITYKLNKSVGDPFTLSTSYLEDGKSEHNIYLGEQLDREMKASYKVQIIAEDQGNPPRQSAMDIYITVTDWNDNLPEFSQKIYNVTIGYNKNRSVPITVVTATDLDKGKGGKITYRISSQTSKIAKSLFRINRETGEIFLQKELDPNKSVLYELFVSATDGGRLRHTALSIVNVNIVGSTNTAPKIEVNFISGSTEKMAVISEGAEIGSFIAYVKVMDDDPDENGKVICDLRHSHFQLQNMGVNKYKVTVRNLIDRETRSLYEITIICQDKGSPPLHAEQKLSIRISDVNDVRPTFSQKTYTFQLYENQKPQIPIGFINATDPDLGPGGEVSFSLLKNPKAFIPFRIGSGAIVIATCTLDRELKDSYRFKVFAQDNGAPSLNNTATVLVKVLDQNDNTPQFAFPDANPFHLDVFYKADQRNITTLNAIDMDAKENSRLIFKIVNGNYQSIFSLDRYSGRLYFSRPPSANDSRTYKLILLVKDSGTPSLSSTTNLTLTLVVEGANARTLAAVKITKDFSLAKNALMVTALLATVGSLSLAILILILVLKMHHLKALCFHRGGTLSRKNETSGKSLGESNKMAASWADISLGTKLNPCISEETLPRKSEDETETDEKKGNFTSEENLHTTSEYDDPITLIETNLSDPSDESHQTKSTDASYLVVNMPPRFNGCDEEVEGRGKFTNMRQVLNPSYYSSKYLMSNLPRMGRPQNTDIDSLHQDNMDMPQGHRALIHDGLRHTKDITVTSPKQDSFSQTPNKQIAARKQQSKIPSLPQHRYQVLENHRNQSKHSAKIPKRKLDEPRSASEQSNSSISDQNSFSDEYELTPTKKTIGSVKPHEKAALTKGLPKYQKELHPFKDPPELGRNLMNQYSTKYAPTSDGSSSDSQSHILPPRKSPSLIPMPKYVPENSSHSSRVKAFNPDTEPLADSQDNIRAPKPTTKLFQSKIPMPSPRAHASAKPTPISPQNQISDRPKISYFPSQDRFTQEQCMDETGKLSQRHKSAKLSKRFKISPDLESQEKKILPYSQTEHRTNPPEWVTPLEKSGKVKDPLSLRREYPENLRTSTNGANMQDGQHSHSIERILNSLKPDDV